MWLLRLLTAAGLAVDAYVHAELAEAYDPVGTGISEGTLFRAQAAAAALAAVLVLVKKTASAVAEAVATLSAAVGFVTASRYRTPSGRA
ncbi:hypothetical protein [Streptomyces sp. 769]|uniref:hypothetical protein n=1 Tax=Streptomyces sp. 769 TaxID=1262452 RepID=UPI0006906F33|nr:hypothetical protein [Streptomyces sp. 769]